MSNIDWSKAPEDATHYDVNSRLLYKVRNGILMKFDQSLGLWGLSVYKGVAELRGVHYVIERPKHEEVDMSKQVFKVGDKVYYPQKSCRVYTIQQSAGEIFPLLVEGVTFTLSGRSVCHSAIPRLIHATPENKALLEQLYRTEFESLPVKLSGSDLTRAT